MLKVITSFKLWSSRWQEFRRHRPALDVLLGQADPAAPLHDRLYWLSGLLQWLQSGTLAESQSADTTAPARTRSVVKLKFALQVLERNPEWRARVAATLRSLVHDTEAVDLFADTGLPVDFGLLGELYERVLFRLLPTDPDSTELGAWFRLLFPNPNAAEWLAEIPPELVRGVLDLLHAGAVQDPDWNSLPKDLRRAMRSLVAHIQAIGLSTPVRVRAQDESSFAAVGRAGEALFEALDEGIPSGVITAANLFRAALDGCKHAADGAFEHLTEHGVSVKIVYSLVRLQAQVARTEALVDLLVNTEERDRLLPEFLATLVREAHEQYSIRELFGQNTVLLARKLVERSAETGEHYITRTRADYFEMLRDALGGGAFTAVTTLVKFSIGRLGWSKFYEGLAAAFNYAGSFVAIQLAGFTLATKQPAMTAPALAAKLGEPGAWRRIDELAEEIAHMIRSQVAAIAGNLLAVAPAVLIIDLVVRGVWGHVALSIENADYVIHSLDIRGPSLFYAAVTGVMLWLSSLAAGWADNWFAYRRIGASMRASRWMRAIFGGTLRGRWASFWERNISGLSGNIALGFMLGLLPAFAWFLGLPLDVRHVTLSTGSLAAAVSALGIGVVNAPEFWLAVLGIAGIGVINLGVSFALALFLAIRAREVRPPQRRLLYRAIVRQLIRKPGSFLLPPRV